VGQRSWSKIMKKRNAHYVGPAHLVDNRSYRGKLSLHFVKPTIRGNTNGGHESPDDVVRGGERNRHSAGKVYRKES